MSLIRHEHDKLSLVCLALLFDWAEFQTDCGSLLSRKRPRFPCEREGEEGLAGKEGRASFLKKISKVSLSSLFAFMLVKRGVEIVIEKFEMERLGKEANTSFEYTISFI